MNCSALRTMLGLTFTVRLIDTGCQVYGGLKFDHKYKQLSEDGDCVFCHNPECSRCLDAEESATMHADCFNLCLQELGSDGSDSEAPLDQIEGLWRLWLAATWRFAWRGLAPLDLTGYFGDVCDPPPNTIEKICGFKSALLPEMARLIQSFSLSSSLWKFCSVLQLMKELKSAEMVVEVVACPLSKVLRWTRGSSSPTLVEDEQTADPYVHVRIDSRGIQSIERVSEALANKASRVSRYPHFFVTELAETVETIKVFFQVCGL